MSSLVSLSAALMSCALASTFGAQSVHDSMASRAGGAESGTGWSERLESELRRSEYHFSGWETGVFTAPNRVQELRARVSAEGLLVFPRSTDVSGEGAPWRLRLRAKSFGRLDDARDLARATVSAREHRAELEHGPLVEWFENSEKGIEQGWTIPVPPAGAEPLWIGLEIAGDLRLRIEEGARSGVLVDASGKAILRYGDLRAYDATGRALEAHLSSSSDGAGSSSTTRAPPIRCPSTRS